MLHVDISVTNTPVGYPYLTQRRRRVLHASTTCHQRRHLVGSGSTNWMTYTPSDFDARIHVIQGSPTAGRLLGVAQLGSCRLRGGWLQSPSKTAPSAGTDSLRAEQAPSCCRQKTRNCASRCRHHSSTRGEPGDITAHVTTITGIERQSEQVS